MVLYYCPYCNNGYDDAIALDRHSINCPQHPPLKGDLYTSEASDLAMVLFFIFLLGAIVLLVVWSIQAVRVASDFLK